MEVPGQGVNMIMQTTDFLFPVSNLNEGEKIDLSLILVQTSLREAGVKTSLDHILCSWGNTGYVF